jgi:hypothetical protein
MWKIHSLLVRDQFPWYSVGVRSGNFGDWVASENRYSLKSTAIVLAPPTLAGSSGYDVMGTMIQSFE